MGFLYPFLVNYAAATAGGTPGESDTHGMIVTGDGGTTAANTKIGSIVMPAGSLWKIFGFWGQVVAATHTAAEAIVGTISFVATSGDLDPNPAPVKFPVPALGSALGATQAAAKCPLQIWPINYEAPGKANIDMYYRNPTDVTVASKVAMGLIFGQEIPSAQSFKFMDEVHTQITSATAGAVGTLTLSERATRITWIGGMLVQNGVMVDGEELIGTFSLDSDDIKMAPAQFPLSCAYGAGIGTVIEQPSHALPEMIPVNIPVANGARVDCTIDLITAVTNGADVHIFIAYE